MAYHSIGRHIVGTGGAALPAVTGSWARLQALETNTANVDLFDTSGGALGAGWPLRPGDDTGWFRINATLSELSADATDADDTLAYWVRP